jgi:hypothetical protein
MVTLYTSLLEVPESNLSWIISIQKVLSKGILGYCLQNGHDLHLLAPYLPTVDIVQCCITSAGEQYY